LFKDLKNFFTILSVIALTSLSTSLCAQQPEDVTIDVCAQSRLHTFDTTRSIITVSWSSFNTTPLTLRYRFKNKTANAWGAWSNLLTSATSFIDTIPTGNEREYQVEADTSGTLFDYRKYGNVLAGHKVPAEILHGRLLLLVDSAYVGVLDSALEVFKISLWLDGYLPEVDYVDNASNPPYVRSLINTSNNLTGVPDLYGVLLIGHIPVPYSGDFDGGGFGYFPPDGHTTTSSPPSHEGAWSTDYYYGDLNGTWTDLTVNNTLGARAENNNTIGDGKFDQTIRPSNVELPVGRIDFNDLPVFTESDTTLMLRYLAKDVTYRSGNTNYIGRVLQDDQLGLFTGEPFGSMSFQLANPIWGDSVAKLDWNTTLQTINYQWAQGIGFGAYNNCVGVVSSANFAANTYRTTFTTLFGSYFGDFDSRNNLMRSALASEGEILTCAWSGRPKWYFHQMGTGNPIGLSTMNTQNNWNGAQYIYPDGLYGGGLIHNTFLGDISLKLDPYEEVSNFVIRQDSCFNRFILSWDQHQDSNIVSYLVQKSDSLLVEFDTSFVVNTTTYIDSTPNVGMNYYVVKAMKSITNCSGMHYEFSHGNLDSIEQEIPEAFAGTDTSACFGELVNIGTNYNYDEDYIFSWEQGDIVTDTSLQMTTALTIGTGVRQVILNVIDTNSGCISKDTAEITTIDLPSDTIITPFTSNACGDSITLSSNQTTGHSYNWVITSATPAAATGAGPHDVSWAVTGNYMLRLQVENTSNGCIRNDSVLHAVACVLPQELISLDYTYNNSCKDLEINFVTTNEYNLEVYEVVLMKNGIEVSRKVLTPKSFSPAQVNRYTLLFSNISDLNPDEIVLVSKDINASATMIDRKTILPSNCPKKYAIMPNPSEAISGSIRIEGLIANEQIEIYNQLGLMVYAKKNDRQRSMVISTKWESGTYLVRINQETFKLILH
jgi:hypothetical protein